MERYVAQDTVDRNPLIFAREESSFFRIGQEGPEIYRKTPLQWIDQLATGTGEFFANLGEKNLRDLSESHQRLKAGGQRTREGKQSFVSMVLQSAGEITGDIIKIFGRSVGSAMSAIKPEKVKEIASALESESGRWIVRLFDPAGGLPSAKEAERTLKEFKENVQQLYDDFEQIYPVEAANLRATGNIAAFVSFIEGTRAKSIKWNVTTKTDEAFFWSGRTRGVGSERVVGKIAESYGGTTLEQLAKKRGVKVPKFDKNNSTIVEAWKKLSREYAQNASGIVRAVVGKSVRPDSLWKTVELPTLLKNSKVTKIITIDPVTKLEKVIFKR